MLVNLGGFEFVQSYFRYYPFALFHLAVAVKAAASLWECHKDIREIEEKASSPASAGAVDVDREIEKARGLLPAFDLYANFFILTGLAGTIFGFYQGLQQSNPNNPFDPKSLAPALATSFFGIVWAAFLNAFSRVFLERRVDRLPWLFAAHVRRESVAEALREIGQRFDQSLAEVSKTVEAVQTQLQEVFRGGSQRFADASEGLAAAASQLSQSVSGSAEAFDRSMRAAADTATKLDQIVGRTAEFPERVTAELQAFSEKHATGLRELSTDLERQYREITAGMLAAVRSLQDGFIETATTASEQYARNTALVTEALRQLLEDTKSLPKSVGDEMGRVATEQQEQMRKTLDVYEQQVARLLDGVAQTLSETRALPAALGERLKELTDEYKNQLQEAMAEEQQKTDTAVRALLLEAGQALSREAAEVSKQARRLVDERVELYKDETERVRDAVRELFGVIQEKVEMLQKDVLHAIQLAPEGVRQEAEGVQKQMLELAKDLQQCSASVVNSAGQLGQSTEVLQNHTGALSAAARELQQAAAKFAGTGPIQVIAPENWNQRLYEHLNSITANLNRAAAEGLPVVLRVWRSKGNGGGPARWKRILFWRKDAA